MKKKLLSTFALGLMAIAFANAQTTVTFKPNAAIGEDATLFMTDGACVLTGEVLPAEDLNAGNVENLTMVDWTFNSIGCPDGTMRSLLRFSQLGTIPPAATITSATLRLYGVPSSGVVPGNTYYPGSPYTPGDNRVYISKVTSTWSEGTVTWNTQPTVDPPAITIPLSATQWNWNYTNSSPALVAMIQDMVTNPAANFGFQLRLEDETNYRSMIFGSSDHTDSTLWPELEVTYTLCNANFTFCAEANNPFVYTFTAVDPAGSHLWEINGIPVGGAPVLNYTFGMGSFYICHTFDDPVKGRCTRCFTLCIPQNSIHMMAAPDTDEKSKTETIKSNTLHGRLLKGDLDISTTKTNRFEVKPNPSNNNWDIFIHSEKGMPAIMKLKTIDGRTVMNKTYELNTGQNTINISGANLPAGTYILEVNQNNQTRQLKLVKH